MKKPQKQSASDNREKPLRIRLTDDERKLLDDFAHEKALATATWARMELLALVKRAK